MNQCRISQCYNGQLL